METVKLTITGNPITKKNSQRLITVGGRPRIVPSSQFERYETYALWQMKGKGIPMGIEHPVNLKCVYFMQTRRRVDLVNLLEATCDILVRAGALRDDNAKIVVSHDGSRVDYDKENPRVEITITEV